VGVDFAEYMIGRNREVDQNLGIEYRCVDIRTSLTAIDRKFDVVCMCEVLEHLDNPEEVVKNAMGLLREGGRFVLTCPHDHSIPDPEHVRVWGHDELFHLLAGYSETVSFTHFPPPYFHIWMMAYVDKPLSSPEPEDAR